MINETKVTGKKYRIWDEATKTWKRLSFWTKASDVEYDENSTVKDQLDQLATTKTIKIGNASKTFDGRSDVSWTLSEIGAAPTASPNFTGIPIAPTASVGTNTTQIATTAFVQASVPTFIYNCTGTADSTAIATIINNFFNSGTAMTMNLIVSGTMGVAFTSTYYAMYINAVNSRGAVCNVDFSNCHIPEITTSTRDFLYISNSTVKINVTGLVVTTTRYCIYLSSCKYNNFTNCTFKTTEPASHMVYMSSGGYNSFTNCTFTKTSSTAYLVYMLNDTKYNSFTNCNFSSDSIIIYMYGSSYNSFTNCNLSHSGQNTYGVYGSNGTDNTFTKCTITSITSSTTAGGGCVYFTTSSIRNTFLDCYFCVEGTNSSGKSYGVYTAANNTSFSNCYISATGAGTPCAVCISSSNINVDFINCEIVSKTAFGISIESRFSGTVNITNCKIKYTSNIGGFYPVYCNTSNTSAVIKLIGSRIYTDADYDVYQSTAASTVKWYIMGNSFSKSAIRVNGTADISYATASAYIYFPQYANFFSQTIQ